jgi:hypothetical protein
MQSYYKERSKKYAKLYKERCKNISKVIIKKEIKNMERYYKEKCKKICRVTIKKNVKNMQSYYKERLKKFPVFNQLNSSPRRRLGACSHSSFILDHGTRLRGMVSFTLLLLYPGGEEYPLDRRLGELQTMSGRYGEVKILEPTGTRTPTHLLSSYTAIPTALPLLTIIQLL